MTFRLAPSVSLRPVTRENWRATLELAVLAEQQAWVADYAPISALMLAKAFIGPGGLVWTPYAVYEGETPVGMLQLVRVPADVQECWLYHFFVDWHWQRGGIGRAALAAFIELVGVEYPGCRAIRLTVHPQNLPARRLYAGAGFVATGELRDGEDVHVLALEVQA